LFMFKCLINSKVTAGTNMERCHYFTSRLNDWTC